MTNPNCPCPFSLKDHTPGSPFDFACLIRFYENLSENQRPKERKSGFE